MKLQRLMVTGAGGFLGSNISRYFSSKGIRVAGVGRFNSNRADIDTAMYEIHGMTLPDKNFITAVRQFKPELLVHCAGTSSVADSVKDPYGDFQRTVEACAFILETIRLEVPNCKFIYLSSAAVYGNPNNLPIVETEPCNPISPYGYHKRMCENLIEEYLNLHGVSSVILRIFSAYGEGLHKQVIHDLCQKFTNPDLQVVEVRGTGKETRDFIHVSDVARAIEFIYKTDSTGYFNLASGEQTSILDLVMMVKQALGSNKGFFFNEKVQSGDPLYWQANIDKIKSTGFSLEMPLQKGINGYCNWFKNFLK